MQSAYSGWRVPSKEECMSFIGKTIPADDSWNAFPSNPSNLFTTLIPSGKYCCEFTCRIFFGVKMNIESFFSRNSCSAEYIYEWGFDKKNAFLLNKNN